METETKYRAMKSRECEKLLWRWLVCSEFQEKWKEGHQLQNRCDTSRFGNFIHRKFLLINKTATPKVNPSEHQKDALNISLCDFRRDSLSLLNIPAGHGERTTAAKSRTTRAPD